MRLLIYLLALFGGFSATETSCRAAEEPGTTVALATIALAQVVADPAIQTAHILAKTTPRASAKADKPSTPIAAPNLVLLSPVRQMDLQRE